MIVWLFPNEPALLHLPVFLDPTPVCLALPFDQLPGLIRQADDVTCLTVEVVNYQPKLYCTLRVKLHGQSASAAPLTLYAKTLATNRGILGTERLHTGWQLVRTGQSGWQTAQPLGCSPTINS